MQDIKPYNNWQYLYTSENDERSPFYGRKYSEFAFTQTVYNFSNAQAKVRIPVPELRHRVILGINSLKIE